MKYFLFPFIAVLIVFTDLGCSRKLANQNSLANVVQNLDDSRPADVPRKKLHIAATQSDGKRIEANFLITKAEASAWYSGHRGKQVCLDGAADTPVNGQYYKLDLCFVINENKSANDQTPITPGVYHPGPPENTGNVSGIKGKLSDSTGDVVAEVTNHPYGTLEIVKSEKRRVGGKFNISCADGSISGEFENYMRN
jgi:hypothetical protein